MISIEIVVPKLKKKLYVTTEETAKIESIVRNLETLVKSSESMFLVDSDTMEMLDKNMSVAEAGFTNATRLIYLSNDM